MNINLSDSLGQNLIINPSMDIAQRGTGPFVNTGYTVDRFTMTTGRSLSINRVASVPTWSSSIYSLELTNASLVTAPASYTTRLIHRVEGYNIRRLKGKNAIFSFNVKGNFNGQSSVTLGNSVLDQSFVQTYNITTGWTRVVIKISSNDFSVGTWDLFNGIGLDISWNLESSADLQSANTGSWQNSLILGTPSDYKFNDTMGNKVWISDVALHEGIEEIPFENLVRDYPKELQLCQRYFEKSYDIDTPVGTVTRNGCSMCSLGNLAFSTRYEIKNGTFMTAKRATPAVSIYSVSTGTVNRITRYNGPGDLVLSSIEHMSIRQVGDYLTTSASDNGETKQFHWTADAEL